MFGKVIQGTVFDCNKKMLESRLRRYDSQLYLRWNPFKNAQQGCWEVRRKPDVPKVEYWSQMGDAVFYQLVYREDDMVHHVKDLPCLYEGLVDELASIDSWATANFLDKWEAKVQEHEDAKRQKVKQEMLYQLKQDKQYLRIFKEAVLMGYNPVDFFAGVYEKDHEHSVYNKPL